MKVFSTDSVTSFRIMAAGSLSTLPSTPAAMIRIRLIQWASAVLYWSGFLAVGWMIFSPIQAKADPVSISAVSPSSGPSAGTVLVRVSGSGFTKDTKFYMGNFSAGYYEEAVGFLVGPTEYLVMSVPFFPGKADLAAVNSSADYSIAAQIFTYSDPQAPAPVPNPVAESGDTLGYLVGDSNIFNLMPASAETSLDIRFQA